MHRLTLAERVEHFKATFPKNPASWPWLVKERGHAVLYARWLGGGDYSAKTPFYGAFPRNFLPKLLALFPDCPPVTMLHAFSGSLPKGEYTRLDVNPALAPDVVGNVYDAPALLGDRRFRLTIADPPYTPEDAKRYKTPGVNRGRATRALYEVTAPRGFLAWLDCCWPMHVKTQWRTVGRIAITRSTNHRLRDLTIFERVGAAAGVDRPVSKPTEPTDSVQYSEATEPEHRHVSTDASVVHIDCARHRHGQMVDGEPEIEEACVNVPYFCARCGVQGGHVSWTRAAWEEHVAKQAAKQARRRTA